MNCNVITELLNIKYPIIQGGMAWIADASLAVGVSEAGGLGIISGVGPTEVVRAQIRKAKELTDKPFGVNVMLMQDNADEIAHLVCDEKVPVVTTGAGSPGKYIEMWKSHGIKDIPVVPSVAIAKRMEKFGADAVIAEGMESGGHIGQTTTMSLVPQVVDAVNIPVIAAGGIASGKQVLAAYALGACGVQVGTCLLASEECPIHENYKQAVIKAKDTSTTVTGRIAGTPVRVIKNKMAKEYVKREKEGADMMELEKYTLGSLRRAVLEGDADTGSLMAGQVVGMINEIRPLKVIIKELFDDCDKAFKKLESEF